MTSLITIKGIKQDKRAFNIEWSDGHKSTFHYMWLRDNCPLDIHPTARERTFNFMSVSLDIHPQDYSITSDGILKINWSEGANVSEYSSEWLRHNCYTLKNLKPYQSPYHLWDSSLMSSMDKIAIDCDEIMSGDEGILKWLSQLHHYGISVVENAPIANKSGYEVLKKISHCRETFFETPFEVINIPNPNNSAYTALGLHNHLDLPYYDVPPGYQFLHCLINDAQGGQSLAVDGFKVTTYMQTNHPDLFNALVEIPVKFCNQDYTQDTIRVQHAPLIGLNKDKDFNEIRFSIAYMGVMDCAPDKMDLFYRAYRIFADLIHDERFAIKFRMKAGDIFSFNNRRILHGRTEYDPNSGKRHLQGYYLDRDEILGRLNYLQKIRV